MQSVLSLTAAALRMKLGSGIFLALVAVGGTPALSMAAERFSAADYTFDAPDGWEPMDTPSNMLAAQFLVRNGNGGDDGLAIVFHFGPGRGGSAEANFRRWESEFAGPDEHKNAIVGEKSVGERKIHLFWLSGTFIGPGRRHIPRYALFAAILESPLGNVYIRVVGPRALLHRHSQAFIAMINDAAVQRTSR